MTYIYLIVLCSVYLMDPPDLPLDRIILCVGACCSLMAGHVHTHNVQMLW